MEVAGNALNILRAPIKAAFDYAGQKDVEAGRSGLPWEGPKTPEQAASRAGAYANVPIQMLGAMLTKGQSLPVQSLAGMGTTGAMQAGGLEPKSPAGVAASGAIPFAGELGSRVLRGLGRTATRVVPGLFQKAQGAAQEELGKVTAGLAKEEAGPLYKTVRMAGDVKLPAPALQAMLDDVDQDLFAKPIGTANKLTKEFVTKGRELIQDGEITLGDLMKFRKELGPATREAPGVAALYKATLGDLEAGSTAGSRLAVAAVDAARKTHGASLFSDLVEKATEVRAVGGADAPALNVAKLAKSVNANRDDLMKFLGPQGFADIENFIIQNRSLPPTHAWTAINKGIGTMAGGAGFLGAGPAGLALAALPELATNIYAVGKTPAAWLEQSRLIPLLAAMRAGLAAQQAPQR